MAEDSRFKVTGKRADLEAVRQELQAQYGADVTFTEPKETRPQIGQREPAGLDPLTYFVVAFAAHLAASLTHDAVHALVEKVSKKHNSQAEKKTD